MNRDWKAVKAEADACTRCDLYTCATRTVFGEGPLDAAIAFVADLRAIGQRAKTRA